jgi:hypothetical protein
MKTIRNPAGQRATPGPPATAGAPGSRQCQTAAFPVLNRYSLRESGRLMPTDAGLASDEIGTTRSKIYVNLVYLWSERGPEINHGDSCPSSKSPGSARWAVVTGWLGISHMIGKVVRGSHAGGLPCYLYGPGRANEHIDPHLVAGFGDPAGLEPDRRPAGVIATPQSSSPRTPTCGNRCGLPVRNWGSPRV